MSGPAGAGAGDGTRESFTVLQIAVWSRARGEAADSITPPPHPASSRNAGTELCRSLSIHPLLLSGYGLPHSELSLSANGSFARY